MENAMQIFKNDEFGQVRTVVIDSEPYFVGKDVAEALGYSNTADAIQKHVDKDDKLTSRFTTSGQSREMTVINESGLYALVFGSKLPTAKKFKRWVTHDILPAIRKTGSYGAPYVLVPKIYRKQSVITTADAAAILGVVREVISQTVNQPLAKCKEARDFFLLQGEELVKFKKENPTVSELASSVLVLLESGFKKVCSYLKLKALAVFPYIWPVQQTALSVPTSKGATQIPVLPVRQGTQTLTDVPDNPKIQDCMRRIQQQRQAMDELLRLYNRYNSPEGQKSLAYSLKSVATELMASVLMMKDIPCNLVEKYV